MVSSAESENSELVMFILGKEGIDITAKDYVYFNNFLFQNNIWNFFKLFWSVIMIASKNVHIEVVKTLVKQEEIEINAKTGVYFNNFGFQNNIQGFEKLFTTALICVSWNNCIEIVKILVEQEGIDINAKDDVYFNNLIFQNNI